MRGSIPDERIWRKGHCTLARVGAKPALARLLAIRPINALARRALRNQHPNVRSRLPLAMPHVDYRRGTSQVRLLDPRVDLVARDIYWGDGQPQSPADARVLRLVHLLCAGGGTFLDIGAYAGLFALVAARSSPETRAIAFEIVPENFLLTWRNIIANDLAGQVEARLAGIGDGDGTLRMPTELGLASLPTSMSLGSRFGSGVQVPLTTVDAVAADMDGPLVMKVDVEGFEPAVFRGARQTIERLKPDIICEFLPDARETGEIGSLLSPLGYRFFQSREEGFHEVDRIEPTSMARDWLLSCNPRIDALIGKAK